MRILLTIALVLLCSAPSSADDRADAGAKVYEYFATFNARDVQKIAAHIYATPVHVGGGDSHRVLADAPAAIANLNNLFEQIGKQGWRESRIEDVKVCLASATLALVDTRYSRIDVDGIPIPPAVRTTLYVLQKIDGDWRIVAFYGHDNGIRPGCEA